MLTLDQCNFRGSFPDLSDTIINDLKLSYNPNLRGSIPASYLPDSLQYALCLLWATVVKAESSS